MSASRPVPASIQVPRLVLLLSTLALVLLGLAMVYSSSMVKSILEAEGPNSMVTYSYVLRQLLFAAVGVGALLICWFTPLVRWMGTRLGVLVMFGAALALILATAVFGVGDDSWGAKRWLYLGITSVQPAEFIKIGVVATGAFLFKCFRDRIITFRKFVGYGLLLCVVPAGLILALQSDLGTTAVIVVGLFAVAWIGEAPPHIFVAAALIVIGVGVAAVVFEPYRAARLAIFLNPWNDGQNGQGDGWQSIHSYWAFAEGGIFGRGLGNSYEKYSYLPMAETDFIFAIIGEELGMVGAFGVVVLFALILWSGLRIAYQAEDAFGTMLAGGLAVMLAFQAFLNMGCALGVFPTTGKPLPFVSYGGSSMVASLTTVGLILGVAQQAGGHAEADRRRDDLRVVHAVGPVSRPRAAGGFTAQRTNSDIPLGTRDYRPSGRGPRGTTTRRR